MKAKILISIFILSLFSACDWNNLPAGSFEEEEITFHIKGTVTNITDNSPVKAFVSFLKLSKALGGVHLWSVWSNDEGQYSMIVMYSSFSSHEENRNEEIFYLEATATRYKTKKITYDDENHVRYTAEWQIIDIQLEPESGGMI